MTENNQRPTFLTVLCILTFIGSAYIILSNLVSLALKPAVEGMTDMAQGQMNQAMDELSNEAPGFVTFFQKMMGFGTSALEHFSEIALIKIIGAGIALFGAILMWKLRKTGFYFYAGAKILIVVALFVILGANGFALLATLGSILVAAIFITLYALNFKALK